MNGEVFYDAFDWSCDFESTSEAYVGNVFVDECGANIDPYASGCPD